MFEPHRQNEETFNAKCHIKMTIMAINNGKLTFHLKLGSIPSVVTELYGQHYAEFCVFDGTKCRG